MILAYVVGGGRLVLDAAWRVGWKDQTSDGDSSTCRQTNSTRYVDSHGKCRRITLQVTTPLARGRLWAIIILTKDAAAVWIENKQTAICLWSSWWNPSGFCFQVLDVNTLTYLLTYLITQSASVKETIVANLRTPRVRPRHNQEFHDGRVCTGRKTWDNLGGCSNAAEATDKQTNSQTDGHHHRVKPPL